MCLAGRFGLVALIANGYRALAYLMLAVFVLPLATIGVARILKSRKSRRHRQEAMMPFRRPSSLILFAALLLPSAALADPPAGFAERVESLRTTLGVPGATVAIVENGRADASRRASASAT